MRDASADNSTGLQDASFKTRKPDANPEIVDAPDQRSFTSKACPGPALLDTGPFEQPALKGVIGQFTRQRPGRPRRRSPLQVVLDGAARHSQRQRDVPALVPSPASRSICLNCLMVSFPFAGITLSLFGTRSVMPQLLTQVVSP